MLGIKISGIISVISLIVGIGGISIFSLYSVRKGVLFNHIKELLKELRSMDSWDDRSEDKLFQWMLESDESTLHYRSLTEYISIWRSRMSARSAFAFNCFGGIYGDFFDA